VPEGDTIHRAAQVLHAALAGKRITKFVTALAQLEGVPLEGRTIERVVAAGKNLIMDFSGDLHLRTHMRMHGSWHIYRPGERWRKRRDEMRILIATDDFVAIAFNVPIAELHDGRSLARQTDMQRIGPDLIAETFDEAEALRRIRERADSEIADVILNQRVVSGIGNEFKSEVLFVAGINPFALVSELSDEQLLDLFRRSRKIMQMNVRKRRPGRASFMSLDPAENKYVYGRGGDPCRKCATPIEYAKQGRDVRGTYWCPRCQAR
jgi:endonuclease VIII